MDTIKIICTMCTKTFVNSSSRNRHLRNVHNELVEDTRKKHIICSLCQQVKQTFAQLYKHFNEDHDINIEEKSYLFTSQQDYESWRKCARLEVDYFICDNRNTDNFKEIKYYCNRSNIKGFKSNCQKRREKAGGSIRIDGVCPSRVIIKFFKNGTISVQSFETHVGHQKEIRSQHLSNPEKDVIVQKLNMGVNIDRIIADAQRVEHSNKLERINLLNRKDIVYLRGKHNVDSKRRISDIKKHHENKETCDAFSVLETLNDDVGGLKTSEEPKDQVMLQESMDEFIIKKQSVIEHVDNSIVLELKKDRLMTELDTLDSETQHALLDEILANICEAKSKPVHKKSKIDKQSYYLPSKRTKT